MKKYFNKIKTGLATFRIALITFPLRVKGLGLDDHQLPDYLKYQSLYGVEPLPSVEAFPSHVEPAETIVNIIIKTSPRLLIAITFIVGIVSFLKIRKIDDKMEKKKKIKKIIIILLAIIIATFLITKLLIWFFTPIPIAYMI